MNIKICLRPILTSLIIHGVVLAWTLPFSGTSEPVSLPVFMYLRPNVNDSIIDLASNHSVAQATRVRKAAIPPVHPKTKPSSNAPLNHSPSGVFSDRGVLSVEPTPIHAYKIIPRYTEEALESSVEGMVVFSLTVSKEGMVRDLKIVKSLGFGLDESALAALEKYRFTPALDGFGQPREAVIQYTFVFSLGS